MPQSRTRHDQVTGRAENANFSISSNGPIASMFHHPTVGVKVFIGEVDTEHRKSDRHWTMLRRKAFSLAGGLLKTKIVIPNELVYYSRCYAPGPTSKERAVQIRQGLIGRTGYNENVSELVFDWFGDGDTVQIAVVGKETLREADDFATAIGLNPVAYSADPDPSQFGSEPFFERPADASGGSDSDGEPPVAGRTATGGGEGGGWSISAMIERLGKRPNGNVAQFGILSNADPSAGRKKNCGRPAVGEHLYDALAQTCTKAAASLQRLPLGAVRSKAAKRAIVAVLAGVAQVAASAGPSAAQETSSAPILYAPQLRPLVLEPPVVLRPHYLGGGSAIASVENTLDLELETEPVATKPEDQPPADIADKVASGPSEPTGPIPPESDSSVSETDEASSRTADSSGTAEGAASDTVAIDNSAADGSAILPEFAAAEPADPQIADAASEETETVGSELAAPPKRPESISAAVVEYGPPQRPEYIANARKRTRRPAASSEPQVAPPSRPQNLQTFAAARTGSSSSPKSKSDETVSSYATENRAIRNARLVLIGVMGKPDQMKALVRLKKGTLVSVSVGDALDGGRVRSIHSDHIVYSKGKRNRRLSMPD